MLQHPPRQLHYTTPDPTVTTPEDTRNASHPRPFQNSPLAAVVEFPAAAPRLLIPMASPTQRPSLPPSSGRHGGSSWGAGRAWRRPRKSSFIHCRDLRARRLSCRSERRHAGSGVVLHRPRRRSRQFLQVMTCHSDPSRGGYQSHAPTTPFQ